MTVCESRMNDWSSATGFPPELQAEVCIFIMKGNMCEIEVQNNEVFVRIEGSLGGEKCCFSEPRFFS
jgi:hypothetical protein